MDEAWERAVESALEGQTDPAGVRTLTLDGAVKCLHGRLPPPSVLEKFQSLQQLSIANIGVSSLEQFPRLRNLQKLILSDNRIAGGLEFLVEAGLDSLRDLDLSNNRMQYIEDLAPLAQLRLVSLDLYECPVTRVKDYRSRVFGLIKSLKYLDKMDAEENERPESDEEDEDDDEEEEEDDPGSGEVDGDERPFGVNNGHSEGGEGIVDVDEDEESDADEEEAETGRARANGSIHQVNGFRIGAVGDGEVGDEDEEDGEDEEDDDDDSGEEVDDEEGDDEDDDVVEVHEIDDSDDEEDGVEDDDEDEEDEDDEEEEVDNEEGGITEPQHQGRLGSSVEGEIDGHEQGEDDEDEDGDGETGEEEQEVEEVEEDVEFEEDEDGEEEEEDYGAGYLVQPVGQVVQEDAGASDMDPGNEDVEHEEVEEEEEEVDDEKEVQEPPPSSSYLKRKRDGSGEEEDDDDEDDEDVIEFTKSSKKHH